jgi:heme/copper-type cytochrome/quinol oxidase subunit 2
VTITRARVWRESKPFLGPAAIVLVYAIVRLGYGAIAGSQGLLTPAGSVDRAQVTLGLAALGLRIFVLVVVVFAVVFRLVMRFLRRWIDPDHG